MFEIQLQIVKFRISENHRIIRVRRDPSILNVVNIWIISELNSSPYPSSYIDQVSTDYTDSLEFPGFYSTYVPFRKPQ